MHEKTIAWSIAKALALMAFCGSPFWFGFIAWRLLFDGSDDRLRFWQVLSSGPSYLLQTCLAIEALATIVFLWDRMGQMARVWTASSFAAIVLLFFGFFLWPTPFVYWTETRTGKPGIPFPVQFRSNRFTGEKQTRIDDEWEDGEIIFD
ncbi:MAG: hypothetical protein P4L46_02100 [Fimbriimonas sp.]|nr:hypothetical protein [Fimbriimonas sp.]